MKKIYNIEEAVKATANDEEITFVVTDETKYDILKVVYYQIKHKTNKEFKHISYEKNKDIIFYILKFFSIISFGIYKLTYDKK